MPLDLSLLSDHSTLTATRPGIRLFIKKTTAKPQIVQKRRAKFIAVSQLTFDYLNTNGALSKFEGELENGADLSFIVNRAKEFNSFRWKPGKEIDSNFTPQAHHPSFESLTTNNEFHQYDSEYNDKSFYSLQCVVDGICPS